MKHLSALLTLSVLSLAGVAREAIAEDPAPPPARAADPKNPFAWLVGTWVGEGLGGVVEETWLPMRAGSMVGTFRLVNGERTTLYELITIDPRGDSFEMKLKHFEPNLASWEAKDESLVWPLESREQTSVRFGPALYELQEDGTLGVWVEIEENGSTKTMEFTYRKVGETSER
jgi:hypothetical protein